MNSTKSKLTLLTSILLSVVCLALICGSTFALFSDSVSTNVNKIQAGTLDVELQMWVADENGTEGSWQNAEGATLDFVQADGVTPIDLWEPGGTYMLQQLRLVNKSNLSLKFKVELNETSAELNKAISWTVSVAGKTVSLGKDIVWLTSEEGEKTFSLCGRFSEKAGNEFQKLAIEGMSVTVYATQYIGESDSFDNQYDKDAEYTDVVSSAEEVESVLANAKPGSTITVTEDFGSDAAEGEVTTITIPSGTKDITIKAENGAKVDSVVLASDGIDNITLSGFDFSALATTNDVQGAFVLDNTKDIGKITITDCHFVGTGAENGRALSIGISSKDSNADVVFDNCTFADMGYPLWGFGNLNSLTVTNCVFTNIQSWCAMPMGEFDSESSVTFDNCKFIDCKGGIFKTTCSVMGTFTFTNNTLTNCLGHEGNESRMFEALGENHFGGKVVLYNNYRDGELWVPNDACGLKVTGESITTAQ